MVSALGTAQRDWLLSVRALEELHLNDSNDARIDRAQNLAHHQALKRQVNLEAILFRARGLLPANVENGPEDTDWAARFFDLAADCADPGCQALWSQLLVMEVSRPGSVPSVALKILAGLSPQMVDCVRIVTRFTINNFFVRFTEDFNADRGLVPDVILLMEEYGILRTHKDMTKVFKSQLEGSFSTNLLYNDKVLRITHKDARKELVLPCYRLTDAGTPLVRALQAEENFSADVAYILEIVKFVRKQGYSVLQADILKRQSNNVVSKHSPFFELYALAPLGG